MQANLPYRGALEAMPGLRDQIQAHMQQLQQQAAAATSSSSRTPGPTRPPAAGPEWDAAMSDVNGGLQNIISLLQKLLQVYDQVGGRNEGAQEYSGRVDQCVLSSGLWASLLAGAMSLPLHCLPEYRCQGDFLVCLVVFDLAALYGCHTLDVCCCCLW